jgi:hypothetical protein
MRRATTFIAAVSYVASNAASTGSSNCRFQIPGGNRTFDLSHLEGSHFEGADTTFGPNGGLFNVSLCGDLPGMLPQSGMCGPFPHARMEARMRLFGIDGNGDVAAIARGGWNNLGRT